MHNSIKKKMHVSFIPYGDRSCVEKLLRDMEAQKHWLPMWKGKKKQKKQKVPLPGQIRILPFGVMEYVFPREDLDMVLRTFNASSKGKYGINFKAPIYALLRKGLKLKKIPKFKKEGNKYLWSKAFVSIIVLGIREDGEIVGTFQDDLGWTHEAL